MATLEDPLRHRLPLTLITATSDARLVEAVQQVVPGWRREIVVLRAGAPWLWLDLEGEAAAELLCLRPLRDEAVVEHAVPEGPGRPHFLPRHPVRACARLLPCRCRRRRAGLGSTRLDPAPDVPLEPLDPAASASPSRAPSIPWSRRDVVRGGRAH